MFFLLGQIDWVTDQTEKVKASIQSLVSCVGVPMKVGPVHILFTSIKVKNKETDLLSPSLRLFYLQ